MLAEKNPEQEPDSENLTPFNDIERGRERAAVVGTGLVVGLAVGTIIANLILPADPIYAGIRAIMAGGGTLAGGYVGLRVASRYIS